jgi:NAD(P)-dependent dehydrogenase (short-subunit alcohol dehydrogenase family)
MRQGRDEAKLMKSNWILGVAAGVGAAVAASALLRKSPDDLEGQVVLITGGSRGLGLSLAREFAARGCRIAICARDPEELANARRDLEERGADVLTVECDVSDQGDVERMLARTMGHFGRIDILVNNAGEIQVGPVDAMTIEDFERAMNVMFWGTVYPTMALLPHLKERGAGRVVNITSIGGKVAVPHLLPYTCAKFAAVGFSEGLHAELAKSGVKVVTIAPGLMRTGSYLNADFKGDAEKESAWFGVSSSLPVLTIEGERAARQIADATARGTAEKILTPQAKVLAKAHGVAPGLTAQALALVNEWLLPEGKAKRGKRGHETETLRSPLMMAATYFGRMAAKRFLQPAAAR